MRKLISIGILSTMLVSVAQGQVESLDDLRQLEKQVKAVAKSRMDVTVAIQGERGGSGSGVIVSEDGIILTAAHVIRGSDMVTIVFPGGKSKKAKVLGANYSKDSALCKMVDEGPWKFAGIASSKDLKVGEHVVAMGHAGGFNTVRTPPVRFGRILSKNPNHFITSDATLIGGDSGGPLFNLKGEVVGIHSNIGRTWNENNHAGVSGFQKDWERLLKGEKWGALSINPMVNPDSPAIGVRNGREVEDGVEISKVLEGGPCDKAGLKGGDVIQELAGKSVLTFEKLSGSIMKHDAGDKITLKVRRGEKIWDVDVVLGRREELKGTYK